jgi:cell division protein FtsB
MKASAFDSVVLVLCLMLYGYLGWHYFYGSRSIAVLALIEAKQADLREELANEMEKRVKLEARVNRLRPEHIDQDFLDEMARRTFLYVHSRELVLPR